MKKVIPFLLLLCFINISLGQNCIQNNLFPLNPVTSLNDGFPQEIADNNEAGDYAIIDGLIIGDDYEFTSTKTAVFNNDYITITDNSNNPIVSGVSPVQLNNIGVDTVRMHISFDSGCTDEAEVRVTTVQSLTNAGSACYTIDISTARINYKSNTRIDFSWEAPSVNTPQGYNWQIVPSGNAAGVGVVQSGSTVAPITNATSGETLTSGTAYWIYIFSDCGINGLSEPLGPLPFTTNDNNPPVNDFCDGALNVVEETGVNNASLATPVNGSLADTAGTNQLAETCNGIEANARDDMWYSFIAQTTDINITLNPSFNGRLSLFSGSCNSLSLLECADANIVGPSDEEISYNSLVVGETYYFRVYFQGFTTPTPNFSFKLWSPTVTIDSDNDDYSDDVDCVDNDPSIYPGAPEIPDNSIDEDCDGSDLKTWYLDSDNDTFGDSNESTLSNTQPSGYVSNSDDCNDSDNSIYLGAPEICDGKDNDCDGNVPASETDDDGDGVSECQGDCDDTNSAINPSASEVCDGLDNNCNGQVDEGLTFVTYYADTDSDGFGDPNVGASTCDGAPTGYVLDNTDCNDGNANVNPSETEILDNGLDDDCNPSTLDSSADIDDDGDGFTENQGDCDDTKPEINPGVMEVCDGIDNNCNGQIDDGLTFTTYYADTDGDGFGDSNISQSTCDGAPSGFVVNNTDCDDSNNQIYPGAPELCDGLDNDCAGGVPLSEIDNDGDGLSECQGDCDDSNSDINPSGIEICDGVDNNCNGQIDEGLTFTTYYADNDGDGFGDPNITESTCNGPSSGFVANNNDCDDGDNTVYLGAPELCDGKDNNCDAQVDEGLIFTTYYADADSDGFGDPNVSQSTCDGPPTGFVLDNTDCDDGNTNVNPGETEIMDNGLDDDCDPGTPDETLSAESFNFNNLTIRPNPFYKSITIDFGQNLNNDKFSFILYDLNGRVIISKDQISSRGVLNIDGLEDLEQGIYLLKVSALNNKNVAIKRIIKL